MLKAELINFDDMTFDQLYKEAINKLSLLYKDWTDHNAHDPGITFLELFSWLTESQRYYLNEVTKSHKLKYLSLLGTAPKKARPARLPIAFSPTSATIKKGEQAIIGGIPFTLEEDITLTDSKISLSNSLDEQPQGAYGFKPFADEPHEGDCFYIHFSNTPHTQIRLYVKIMPPKELKRNPMKEGYYKLAQLQFDIKDTNGWLKCQVEDKTYGLIQSGSILIKMPKACQTIRCTLKECHMDIPPMLERIYVNYAELIQYQEVYSYHDNANLKSNVVAAFKRTQNGYIKAQTKSDVNMMVYADQPYREGEHLVQNNQIDLQSAPLSIIDKDFSLLVHEEDGIYRQWSMVDDLSCSSPHDRHYVLDETNGIIHFGDNIHGKSAQSAVITSMRLTHGGVTIKRNNKFTIASHRAFNPLPSTDGINSETLEQAFMRVKNYLQTTYRAITSEDYKAIVMQTPALCVDSINVYSPKDGVVNICINTSSGKLVEPHIRNIRRYLYGRRLPCTQINIIAPKFWDCSCSIHIVLNEWALNKKQDAVAYINSYFKQLEKTYALKISPSLWQKELERCPFIKKIEQISLNAHEIGKLTEQDQITLPPDSLLRIVNKEIIMEQ